MPFGEISLHPSASAIQYGQAIFDGFKAYRCEDGVVRLFRPQAHLQRVNHSATRLCMPAIDEEMVLEAIVTLIGLDQAWVPSQKGHCTLCP